MPVKMKSTKTQEFEVLFKFKTAMAGEGTEKELVGASI